MPCRTAAVLALGVAALTAPAVSAQGRLPGDPAGRHGWLFSLEEGKAQARKSGKPIMVVLRCQP